MKRFRVRVFLLALIMTLAMTLVLGMGTAFANGGSRLFSVMIGANELAGGDTHAFGTAALRLNPGQGTVCFDVDVFHLSAPVTAAHIHQGAKGVNGPVVVNFNFPVNGLDNCVTADKTLIQAIINNPAGYYTNVHTTAFPGGAIRGQLHGTEED
ncbi:MAG TPA: CHRD domain-containing protein [Ktedonosporobacter sp.]|nr:CHRD domain-containing protein [Ktedonosporobacter sp.]